VKQFNKTQDKKATNKDESEQIKKYPRDKDWWVERPKARKQMAERDTQGDIKTLQLRTKIPDLAYSVTFYYHIESSEAISGILMCSSWQPLIEHHI
jgi:hypothetical protein